MTVLTDLIAARTALAAELATQSAKTDKPDYSIAGRSVSWSAYRADLIAQLKELNTAIIKERGAVELQTIALG